MTTYQKLITGVFLLLPSVSHACTVCFGGADSDLRKGFFWGIVVLGALPFIILSSFIGVLVRNHKKRQKQGVVS